MGKLVFSDSKLPQNVNIVIFTQFLEFWLKFLHPMAPVEIIFFEFFVTTIEKSIKFPSSKVAKPKVDFIDTSMLFSDRVTNVTDL